MMELLNHPLIGVYGLPVAGAIVIIATAFFWGRRKGKNPQADPAAPIAPAGAVVAIHAPIDVRLYDSTIRRTTMAVLDGTVADEILKQWRSLGRKWLFEGKWVFAINRYAEAETDAKGVRVPDGRYMIKHRPVEAMMRPTREHPPSDVHSAISNPEIDLYFDVTEKSNTLQKLMPVLVFAGAGIFVLFMWSQS
jgi:nitrogen fixation-related uncharacterized protein